MKKEFRLDETKASVTVKYNENSLRKIDEFEKYCTENGLEYIIVQAYRVGIEVFDVENNSMHAEIVIGDKETYLRVYTGDDVDSISFGEKERG